MLEVDFQLVVEDGESVPHAFLRAQTAPVAAAGSPETDGDFYENSFEISTICGLLYYEKDQRLV
jgi:hypothetical protein